MENVIDLVLLHSRIKNMCEGFDGMSKSMPLESKTLILIYLHKHGSASNLELTAFLNFAKSNVALLCKKMMQEGLVDYSKNVLDSRNKQFVLTENGKMVAEEIEKTINNNVRSSIQNVSNMHEVSFLTTKLLELLR